MLLTLIQTSQNKPNELKRFIKSLNDQENVNKKSIQYIFIDQGENNSLFNELSQDYSFIYIKSISCSLSKARNIGLKYALGKYICFPDDDCWYDKDTLDNVIKKFDNEDTDGIVGVAMNEEKCFLRKYPSTFFTFSKYKFDYAMSITMFTKLNKQILFDENLGVGSNYNLGSGEESDYLLSLLNNLKYKIIFDTSIIVFHPNIQTKHSINKTYLYARGYGYLLKKHRFNYLYILLQLAKPLIGIFIYSSLFKKQKLLKSYSNLKGRTEGLFYNIKH